jgi:hypothetical protein
MPALGLSAALKDYAAHVWAGSWPHAPGTLGPQRRECSAGGQHVIQDSHVTPCSGGADSPRTARSGDMTHGDGRGARNIARSLLGKIEAWLQGSRMSRASKANGGRCFGANTSRYGDCSSPVHALQARIDGTSSAPMAGAFDQTCAARPQGPGFSSRQGQVPPSHRMRSRCSSRTG